MMQRPRSATRTLVYCGLLFAATTAPALAGDPTGDWRVADGVANIRVAECRGNMWGAVAWEKIPGGRDRNNPDTTKQSRPTLGMAILIDMKKKKPNVDQWAGQVYNAKDGKLYESTITLKNPNQLEIEGCVLGFLCGGETWTRVSDPIPSSPSNAVAEAQPKAGSKSAPAKTGAHAQTAPAPAPKAAAKAPPPKTIGQKTAPGQKTAAAPGTTETEDTVGDICLLPEIARAAH
jgi:uncharacterized protein (DUF2147 family)